MTLSAILKKSRKAVCSVLLFWWLGASWGQPVYTLETGGTLESVLSDLDAALELEASFDISGGLAARGVEIAPYTLILLTPTGGVRAAVHENHALGALLPPTIYLHAPEAGGVTLGVLDMGMILPGYELSAETEDALMSDFTVLYEALELFGPLQKGEAPQVQAPLSETLRLAELPYAEASLFIESSLASQNYNVVEHLIVGGVSQLYACKLAYGEALLAKAPALGVMLPCRLYFFPDGRDTLVGHLRAPEVSKLYALEPDVQASLERVLSEIDQALRNIGAE